ncbi:hypothetical protein HDV00_011363 [Rhizophlyctis rosea]|nr:hypothetical protein HDV00_011363 [Rhizophlyctis rosea]
MQRLVIVGGGVFGLSCALALKKRGYRVTVLDRRTIPAEDGTSVDINRIVRVDYATHDVESELAGRALELWWEWNREADGVFEDNSKVPLFVETGILLTCQSETLGHYEAACVEYLRSAGYGDSIDVLTAVEIAKRFPVFEPAYQMGYIRSGYFNQRGGVVNARRAVEYLKQRCLNAGVEFCEGEGGTVEKILERPDENGLQSVMGVQTMDGKIHDGKVIVASGAWSAALIPELRSVMAATGQSVIYVDVPAELVETQKLDMLECPAWTMDIARTGMYGFPAQQGVVKHPTMNGLVVATGGSGHGFKFAPVVGDIVADIVEGRGGDVTEYFAWRVGRGNEDLNQDGTYFPAGDGVLDSLCPSVA